MPTRAQARRSPRESASITRDGKQRRETCRSAIVGTVLIGYARVSTAEQNPAHQVDALARAGVAAGDIYVDTASGAKASRPHLNLVLKLLRAGHTLKITRLYRLPHCVLL